MAFDDGVKVGPIAYIGGVSVLLTFAIVLLLQVLYYSYQSLANEAELADQGPPVELTELTSKQQTALTQRGYIDRERGVVAVGVDRAKQLVLEDLADGKSPGEVIGPKPPVSPPKKEASESTAKSEEETTEKSDPKEGAKEESDNVEEEVDETPVAKQESEDEKKS